jgi:hypothetical protein
MKLKNDSVGFKEDNGFINLLNNNQSVSICNSLSQATEEMWK